MEANSKNLRDLESIQLSDSITSLDCCVDFIAAGCLDDTVYIWYSVVYPGKKTSPTSRRSPFLQAKARLWVSWTWHSTLNRPIS